MMIARSRRPLKTPGSSNSARRQASEHFRLHGSPGSIRCHKPGFSRSLSTRTFPPPTPSPWRALQRDDRRRRSPGTSGPTNAQVGIPASVSRFSASSLSPGRGAPGSMAVEASSSSVVTVSPTSLSPKSRYRDQYPGARAPIWSGYRPGTAWPVILPGSFS